MSNTPYAMGSFNAASGGSLTPNVPITTGNASGDNVYVAVMAVAGTVSGVTDTQGQTYTLIKSSSPATACQLFVFACLGSAPLTTSDKIIPTYTVAGAQCVLVAGDNGVQASIDLSVQASATSGTTASVSTGTLSNAEEHLISFCASLGTANPSYTTPFTNSLGATNNSNTRLAAAYDDVTATTSVTSSATVTTADWAIVTITVPVTAVAVTTVMSNAVQGMAYSQTLENSGGVGPYTWTISSGTLPTGLTLASGVISGTPTVNGTFTFTTQVTDTHGVAASAIQTIHILPSGAGGVPATSVPNNLLLSADSDFETAGFTWAADVNANAPFRTSQTSFSGTECLAWTSAADGLTQICTGLRPCKGNTSYSLAGFILPAGMNDIYWGVHWYTSGGTLISSVNGNDNQSNSNLQWQCGYAAVTSPSNAAQFKMFVQVAQSNKGDLNLIDLPWFVQVKAQVLIDWLNSPYVSGSIAGQDFMDVSPWVRMDQGIQISRGRQDSISEITAGSASFELENDTGLFTRLRSSSIPALLGGGSGNITLNRRCQINLTDQNAVWYTRFDGPISEIDYAGDNTGNTNAATVSVTDVLAPLNRQDNMSCWTVEQVLSLNPIFHWTLDDAGNAGGSGVAAETSGNNGPPMRTVNSDTSGAATITWQDSTGGVETQADAVSPGAGPAFSQGYAATDGSEYWTNGSDQPTSQLRGLDSSVPGPYTTPLSSVLLTPQLTAKTAANYFTANTGYQLQATLPQNQIISPSAADGSHDYAVEMWFTMGGTSAGAVTTGMIGSIAANVGPFICLSLGSTRFKNTLVAGMFVTGGQPMNFEVATYNQPPAFLGLNWPGTAPPSPVSTATTTQTVNANPLPHHLVLNIAGDPVAPTISCWLDGVNFGTITLSAQQVFDTICIGGCFGGCGAWCGNVSSPSIYNYQLSSAQITTNCQMGQYGMWESTTDDCIAQLASFANVPSFWNNLAANHNGLTLAEYQDINGSNALSSMQLFEQLEMGLLFVDAKGRMNFNTRDMRMGHGAPDLLLPPDSFDSSMGYQTIDQFQINEQAVCSQIFSTGGGYINQVSQAEYGVYATNAINSPLQLPIISWNRAFAALQPAAASNSGVTSFSYWADPYMYDYSAWLANSHSDPWLTPGALTIDLMSTDTISGAPTISQYYALEIGSMIAPSGTLPASFPNASFSMEWFIEGINETITQTERTIQFYTSPAETQRAWKPGDATYGCLDSTARIGISAPDTSKIQASGKDVSHDAGRPYWPPTFATTMNNPSGNGDSFIGALDIRGLTDNLNLLLNPPLCVVSATSQTATYATGALTQPQMAWDTVHVDTVGGMGLMPGWPNWYVCLVPGFYEIDGCVNWAVSSSSGGSLLQAWIVVAQAAGQALANGSFNPTTVGAYVCPIGEGQRENTVSFNTACNPTTRMYLGLGDMVAIAVEHDETGSKSTATGNGGSHMSIRWVGYGRTDDRVQINSGGANPLGNPTSVANQTITSNFTKVYTNTDSYTYYGASASTANKFHIRYEDFSPMFQGTWDADNGSQYGIIPFNYNQMLTDMPNGTVINSATLSFTCTSTYYSSGGKLMLGSCYSAVGQNPWQINYNSKNTTDIQTQSVVQGVNTFPITTRFIADFLAANTGGRSMRGFLIGNDSTTNKEYSIGFNGLIGTWTLTVNASITT